MVGIGVIRVDIKNPTVDRLRLLHLSCLVQVNPFLNELRSLIRRGTRQALPKGLRRTAAPIFGGLPRQFLLVTFRGSVGRFDLLHHTRSHVRMAP